MNNPTNSDPVLAASMEQMLAEICSKRTGNPNLALVLHYVFKVSLVVTAAIAIVLGYRLFVLGITGQASLSVESKTISGQLLNAAPGLFFALGGLVCVIVTAWRGVTVKFPAAKPRNSAFFTANTARPQCTVIDPNE